MENLDRIVETFEFFEDWEDRYRYLEELGERLPAFPEALKTDEHLVHGCVSQVWVVAEPEPGSQPLVLRFRGDSDTPIIKGILAILLAMYDGSTPEEALALDPDDLFRRLGIYDHLSPNRHVGVYAMVEKFRNLARAWRQAA
jgi:cysteine desulfuration protein SufE